MGRIEYSKNFHSAVRGSAMTLLNYFHGFRHITHQHRDTPILFPMPMTKVRWKI
ncbi:hypothetical protein HMPREF9996_01544 [Aggregatibacter actinomycetemcomitans Y4]|nr:hypothetical protein HMPREF9996_01544 [Aggregatibacter actinomycetemcomitans Y4]